MRPSKPLFRFALVATLGLSAACFDYDDSSGGDEDTAVPDTTETPDTEEDTGADADEDTATDVEVDVNPWPEVPEYNSVACSERTPVNGATTLTPLACDYEVTHPAGITDIVESCGGGSDLPMGLHLSFPSEDASTAIAMTWTTPNTTRESVVRIGTSPDALDHVVWGHTFTYVGLTDRVVHEVHVCGLEAGRTYYYQAGGEGAWSDVYSFATAPAWDSDEEIIFAVAGDSRSDTFEIWGSAVEQMRELGAEFIVFSGDAVESGPVQAQWDRFFEQGQPGMAEMPYIPCNGNHDLLVSPWFGQFALPGDETNFAVRYGPLAFVSMTDFNPAQQHEVGGAWAQYIDDAYTRHADAAWKFLVNHRPLYSASTRHGSADDLRDAWQPILDEHEVALVFNGHDHNYERSRPIRNDEVVPFGEGTIYTVVAGVGAPLYDNGSQWWTETSDKVESFAIVRVTPETLEFTAYRVDGTRLDSFTWDR